VLFLYENDFDTAANNYQAEKRKTALVLLNRVLVFKDWNMIRKQSFADTMRSLHLEAGEYVYNTGEEAKTVYFVRKGSIKLEIFFEVRNITMAPTQLEAYERRVTRHLVKKVIKVVNSGQFFGLEEIIRCNPVRVVRAKVIKSADMFICTKKQLLSFVDRKDIRQFIEYCKKYTDFNQQGISLAN